MDEIISHTSNYHYFSNYEEITIFFSHECPINQQHTALCKQPNLCLLNSIRANEKDYNGN